MAKEPPRLTSQGLTVLKLFIDTPREPRSGAGIMRETGLSSGTLYPLLLRFEDHGMLKSDWEDGDASELGRPRRRLYTITAHGQKVARTALASLGVPGLLRPAFGRV